MHTLYNPKPRPSCQTLPCSVVFEIVFVSFYPARHIPNDMCLPEGIYCVWEWGLVCHLTHQSRNHVCRRPIIIIAVWAQRERERCIQAL